MKRHILNRILPACHHTRLRRLALAAIASMRHLDMPKRLARLGFAPRVILDVGAARGNWARLAAGIWPQAWIFGFEPNRHHLPALERAAAQLPDFAFHNCFLGPRRIGGPIHASALRPRDLLCATLRRHVAVVRRTDPSCGRRA